MLNTMFKLMLSTALCFETMTGLTEALLARVLAGVSLICMKLYCSISDQDLDVAEA